MKHSKPCTLAVAILMVSGLLPACVQSTSMVQASSRSGKTDLPMLLPTGKTAKWNLSSVVFDEKQKPSYALGWKNPSRLEGQYRFGVMAYAKSPDVPKVYQPDGYSSQTRPIDFSQEIFIPAINRKVAYYCDSGGGGSENATYSTLPIAWPDGHGGTIYYVIWAESDAPEKILSQVKWTKPGSMADAKVPDDGTIIIN